MHYRLKSLSLASLVLSLSLSLPVGVAEPQTRRNVQAILTAQAQTTQQQKVEAEWLFQLGVQQFNKGKYKEALDIFEQALVIFRNINEPKSEAATRSYIGLIYNNSQQYTKALDYLQQALTIYQQTYSKEEEGATLNNIGNVYLTQKQYSKVLDYYKQALVIAKNLHNQTGEGRTLSNIGGIYEIEGEYTKALEYYQKALAISQQIDDRLQKGRTLLGMGDIYIKQRQYSKALEHNQQALAIAQQISDQEVEAKTLNNIGIVYFSQGQYSKALDYYQHTLAIAQQSGNTMLKGWTLRNMGEVYNSQGQYAEALKHYQQALDIAQQISEKKLEIDTINDIGIVYRFLEQYSKALEYYTQALNNAKQIGDQEIEASSLINLGELHSYLGQYNKALEEFYKKALVIGKQIGNQEIEAGSLNNIGEVYQRLGEYSKALEYYQQALLISRKIEFKDSEEKILNNIGFWYDYQGQYSKALKYYTQALAIAKLLANKLGEGNILENMGFIYNASGNYLEAEKKLFATIHIWEKLRPNLKDDQKISIFERHVHTYRLLQQVLVTQNKNSIALEIAERGRARAFVELIASKQSYNSDDRINIKPPNIEQVKQISQEQNATLVEYSIINEPFKIKGREEWQQSKLYIWVVKPTGKIEFKQVDIKSLNTSLVQLVNKSRLSIGAGGRGIRVEAKNESNQKQNLQKLYQVLIEPIASLLPTNPDEHVIFIPHDSLFLVPFVALQDKDGKYLIEKHTILTAPAIQVLDLTHQQRQKVTGKDVLVMGNPIMPKVGIPPVQLNPLLGAQKEAVTVASLFKTKAITGKDATKAAFKQKLSSARIIHLATHGLLDDADKSIPSAIALTPTSNDDGLLTPAEIVDLKINAELVVLSACDTGRGKITGDGVVGLSRSLITAGASSVIVSLWAVPDSPTSELMTEFYQQWQKNPDKAAALRNAMLITMKKHPQPRDWAAFTLIGES